MSVSRSVAVGQARADTRDTAAPLRGDGREECPVADDSTYPVRVDASPDPSFVRCYGRTGPSVTTVS